MRDLNGKTAVVTGAASGIGRALAAALAGAGMNLGLIDVDRDALERSSADLTASGVRVRLAQADVSVAAELERAAAQLADELGPAQLVCNNAGVALRGPILATSHENFNWLYAVNVGGTFNTIKAFVPGMIARGAPGHMLVTCSLVALYEMRERQNAVYTSTKMAIYGLARSLRAEVAPHGIGVSALFPGVVVSNARRSGEYRPARFGGPFTRPDQARAQAGAMPADELARIALRGIADDVFLIATHPAAGALIAEQTSEMLAAYGRWEGVLADLGISTTYDPVPPDPKVST